MKKTLKTVLIAVAVLSVVFAAGCGGQQPAASEAPEATVYLAGCEPTFPPFEMTDDNGEIIGFDIDLLNAIAANQGFEVEFQSLGFDGLIAAVQTGNIDIIASGMSITEEREESVDFSAPYIDAGLAIAVTEDNETVAGVEDLEGAVVGVQIGTTGAAKAEELLEAGIVAEVKTYNTVDVVMMELAQGTVQAVINDLPVTEAYMSKQSGIIKVVGETLASDSYGFAVMEGNAELLEMINAGLEAVKADGTYDEIVAKYF